MKLDVNLLCLLSSFSLGSIALNCVRFGVSWLVMRETGSAAAFAAIFSASSFVEVFFKPVLSPMADYFDRLKVYRICVALGSVLMLALLAAVMALPFSIALLTGLLMLLSLVAGLRDPACAGLVPALVAPERLTEAQALLSSVMSVISLAAPLLSALLLAAGGVPAALAAAVLSATLAAVFARSVKVVHAEALPTKRRWAEYLRSWHLRTADGIRAVCMTRSERFMALVVSLTNAGLFPFFVVVLPLWVGKGMGAGAATMAAVEVAFGVGIFAGSAWLVRRMNQVLGRFFSLVAGNALLGAGLVGAALFRHPAILCAFFLVAGSGFAVFNVNVSTLRAAATPAAFRSRMAAGVAFLSSCLNPFATQGMGFVMEGSGPTFAVTLCGALILVSTALLLRNADAKKLLARSNDEIMGAYATMYPKAFAERP